MPYVKNKDGQRPGVIVAVEGVCAWPNLTQLPDGTIVALIYNQPSHGRMPGDVECWASEDGGETWTLRSVAAPRGSPEQNRMNVAAGLTADGDLILITSGWSAPGDSTAWSNIGEVLSTWVCISKDGGYTWTIDRDGFPDGPDGRPIIPFGDIMPGADGRLRVPAYRGAMREDEPRPESDDPLVARAAGGQHWIVRGDGEVWDEPVPIGEPSSMPRDFTETAILHLGGGEWLAAARYGSGSLWIQTSDDDAATWTWGPRVTRSGFPGHILRLDDNTLILSYGMRASDRRGVEVMFSDDNGRSWSEAYRLLDTREGNTDIGYPSSVLRQDGMIVTVYYEGHPRSGSYFMGAVVWDPAETRKE